MNNLLNRISVIFFFSEFTCVTFISFSNVFLIQSCKESNARKGINEVCGMVGRIWLPFDYDYFPIKPIVFGYEVCIPSVKIFSAWLIALHHYNSLCSCLQLFASLLAYHNAGYINWVIYESVEHVNFRFHHLHDTFNELLEIHDPIERRKQFNKAVEYHNALIE